MAALPCAVAFAQPTTKVPSAVLRPFVPALVKPVDIVPALPTVKEVYILQPIVSKTPVTEALKTETLKAEPLKAETLKVETIKAEVLRTESTLLETSKTSHDANHVSSELAAIAENFLGVRYKFGANDPKVALDCSALIVRIMEAAGKKNLPRTAHMLAATSKPVETDNLKVGDLLFFNTRGWDFSHVGMYMGGGRFVHASQQKGKVTFSTLSASYFAKRFTGARRVIH
ncbi:MAG: C40 family peptidase [Limnobacter sp.]|nr:C40 family peptidase [Limnobacter sp.]